MTMCEPPSSASDELIRVTSQSSGAIEKAMRETLEMGADAGVIKPRVDLGMFADRLCKVLLHISLGVFNNVPGGDEIPAIRLRALVDGIAPDTPSDKVLDASVPLRAAADAIAGWGAGADEDARLPALRAAARGEFGKRGYEATTMRDIAKAAGMSVGSVYRVVGSKDELLGSIMESFEGNANAGWLAIVKAEGSVVEKLDALMWLDINLVERFRDEYMIRLAWLRESPPSNTNLGTSFGARLNDLKSLLAAGKRSGELRVDGPSADIRAWAIFELLWFPAELVATLGLGPSHALARNTLLRGGAPST
jgi:AcrR family transcriptional regulator